jgi:hypothetical protein
MASALALIARERGDVELSDLLIAKADEVLAAKRMARSAQSDQLA